MCFSTTAVDQARAHTYSSGSVDSSPCGDQQALELGHHLKRRAADGIARVLPLPAYPGRIEQGIDRIQLAASERIEDQIGEAWRSWVALKTMSMQARHPP